MLSPGCRIDKEYQLATDETEFTQVFRGYDRDEVDKVIQGLRRDVITSNNHATEAAKDIKRLNARIDELSAELEEVGSPTFSGLGTKLENTLRVAEEQSTRLIAQADIDAEKLRSSASGEVEKIRSQATTRPSACSTTPAARPRASSTTPASRPTTS